MRLDKWLWCCRFFKTRGAAAEAVRGGKIQLNGERTKPAKTVTLGDLVRVTREHYRLEVEVREFPVRRGPASEAQKHYLETADSRETRELEQAKYRDAQGVRNHTAGKPNKKDRRQLQRLRGH